MAIMLTTIDNPFNPFTEWDEWYAFDQPRYQTTGLLARVARTSSELSVPDQEDAIEQAMKEIVEFNYSGVHRLVSDSS